MGVDFGNVCENKTPRKIPGAINIVFKILLYNLSINHYGFLQQGLVQFDAHCLLTLFVQHGLIQFAPHAFTKFFLQQGLVQL